MKILIDMGHPAHVHLFKNFIWEMKKRGHKVKVTTRDKDVTIALLDKYKFDYECFGSPKKGLIRKILGITEITWWLYKQCKKFKPDILLSLTPYTAYVSKIIRKPAINFIDDDIFGDIKYRLMYTWFDSAICTPKKFRKNLGKKHIRYNGYHELAYLHPNRFKPNPEILKEMNLNPKDTFFLLRFVSLAAWHDKGKEGWNTDDKLKIVKELEKKGKVFITSEKSLPKELEPYRYSIHPEKIHHIMYYATLFVTDSQTMTTESALLGTPAVRCNSFVGPEDMSNFIELEKDYGLIFSFNNKNKAFKKIVELINIKDIKTEWNKKRNKLIQEKIDVTKWMIWLAENFPESFKEMKKNPDKNKEFK